MPVSALLEVMVSRPRVEAHKFNFMRKLDIHNRADLVDFAIQQHIVPAPVAVSRT